MLRSGRKYYKRFRRRKRKSRRENDNDHGQFVREDDDLTEDKSPRANNKGKSKGRGYDEDSFVEDRSKVVRERDREREKARRRDYDRESLVIEDRSKGSIRKERSRVEVVGNQGEYDEIIVIEDR